MTVRLNPTSILVLAAGLWACAHSVSAQESATPEPEARLRIALFQTTADDPSVRDLATALDPVLAAELDHSSAVTVGVHPSIDLAAMQLAIDCVSETAECLRMVTEQTHVEGLVSATLRRAGASNVVTLFYFDSRGVGTMKGVTRKHQGDNMEQDMLDGIPAMIDELFDTKSASPTSTPPDSTEPAPSTATQADIETSEPQDSAGLPIGPIVLGAGGVVLLGTGIGLGLAANSSEDDYAKLPTNSKPQIEAAQDKLDSAKSLALFANIGIGVGAAAIAGSVIWWLLTPKHTSNEHATLSPIITPRQVGLTLRGSFAGSM